MADDAINASCRPPLALAERYPPRRRPTARLLFVRRSPARNSASRQAPTAPSSPCPRPTASLRPARKLAQRERRHRAHVHGVVSICSPVNTAFAPAMKHIACCVSSIVCRPAASRIIVAGSTIRAVATVRNSVWNGTGCTHNYALIIISHRSRCGVREQVRPNAPRFPRAVCLR